MSDHTKESPQEKKRGALARLLSSIKFLIDPELPVEDRRMAARVTCDYRVDYVDENGVSGSAQVLEVSRRGMRLRGRAGIARGLTIAVNAPSVFSALDFSPLMAKVMWTCQDTDQQYLCGLLLPPGIEDEETWLEAALTSLGYSGGPNQRRRFIRAESELNGTLSVEKADPVSVVVLNLGLGGALLRAEHALARNAHFLLNLGPLEDLPALELAGTILKQSQTDDDGPIFHSTRFAPLEQRRHSLLKEYVAKLLKPS